MSASDSRGRVENAPGHRRPSGLVGNRAQAGITSLNKGEFKDACTLARDSRKFNPYKVDFNQQLVNYIHVDVTTINPIRLSIDDAVRRYWAALTAARDTQNVSAAAMGWLKRHSTTTHNRSEKVSAETASFRHLTVYRGTGPVQAMRILIERTLGGESASDIDLPSPGETAAKTQTGENIKDTPNGRIEEWSTAEGGLQGFATGGVMLIGSVRASSVQTANVKIGEQGATGFANQRLRNVAILNFGKPSVAEPATAVFDLAKQSYDERYHGRKQDAAAPKTGRPSPLPEGGQAVGKYFE